MDTAKDPIMDTAKVTTNGQVTIPIDFRKLLNIKPGNKVLFLQSENGEVVLRNASASAFVKAQTAFADAAADLGYTSEEDILDDVMSSRRSKKKTCE